MGRKGVGEGAGTGRRQGMNSGKGWTSPRISNPMVNNVSVPCTEIMGTHL